MRPASKSAKCQLRHPPWAAFQAIDANTETASMRRKPKGMNALAQEMIELLDADVAAIVAPDETLTKQSCPQLGVIMSR